MAWYNKYRPCDFESVIGQELTKSVLQNSLRLGKLKHGYLFSGGKGVGKTTLARIFASQLNKTQDNPSSSIDIIEMDAASNTGIEDIRQLIDFAQTPPLAGEYKIYIIDEVHMLSKAAMNALLKILEEPPSYLIFLLATTNPEKLLPTVLSRLTRLNLSSHSQKDLVENLAHIATLEKVDIDTKSLNLIAKRANGSQRDAINILETVASYQLPKYDSNTTAKLMGMLPEELLLQIADNLIQTKPAQELVNLLEELETTTIDGELFLGQLLELLLDLSLNQNSNYDELILAISQVLELKLNLSYIPSTIALLSIYLKKNRFLPENTNQNSTDSTTLKPAEIIKKKVEPVEQQESILNLTTENIKKPDESKQETTTLSEESEKSVETPEKKAEAVKEIVKTSEINQVFPEAVTAPEIKENEEKKPVETKKNLTNSQEQSPVLIVEDDQQNSINNEILFNPNSEIKELTIESDLNIDSVQQFLVSMSKKEGVIPIYKMIAGDILVEEITGNQITLSVSSPIFLSNLKSPKLRDYITDQINQKFDVNNFLEIVQREKNNNQATNLQTNGVTKTLSDKPSKHEEISGEGIFYSIYKQAPENLQQPIPIKTEEIKPPESSKGNWENSVNSMFEFED